MRTTKESAEDKPDEKDTEVADQELAMAKRESLIAGTEAENEDRGSGTDADADSDADARAKTFQQEHPGMTARTTTR
jgi:hypothetical protein